MKSICFKAFGLALGLLASTPAWATTYYVATTGNDTNNGTSVGTPWLTAQKAANTAVAGDTVTFADGTYVTPSLVINTNAGTSGNPITFKSTNSHMAVLSSTSGCTPGIVVMEPYITIQGFRLAVDPSNVTCNHYTAQAAILWAAPGTDAHPTAPTTQWHDLIVSGVYADSTNVTSGRSIGMKSNQDNSTFDSNIVYGSIEALDVNNFVASNNTSYGGWAAYQEPQINMKAGVRNAKIFNNTVHGQIDGGSAITLGGNSSGYWWDATLFLGSISGTTLTVTTIEEGGALQVGGQISLNEATGVTPGTTILKQLTGTTGSTGTYQVSVSQTIGAGSEFTQSLTNLEGYNDVAYDNVIINETTNTFGNSAQIRGCSNCAFFNNVMLQGEQLSIATGSESGFPPYSKSINPTFANNILYGNNGAATSGYFGWAGNYTGTLTVDHNDFFNYASAIPTQTNAVLGDPLFVNNASDWHLQTGSPAIAAGATETQAAYGGGTLDVSHDYTGTARTAPWDLGIYSTAAATVTSSINPFHYPVPLTCTRDFYVRPGGTDTSGCGTANTDAAACKTMAGADANITTGGGLTGGDCVHFAAGTYNTGGHLVLSKSGTANQANGYITYMGAPNLGSKIYWDQPSYFGGLVAGNYVAFVGLEFDGHNLGTYTGYNASSTNTYNAQYALFDPQGAGHHHMFFNNKMHSSGGAALNSSQYDYEVAAGNEIYDMAGVNPCGASGISVYEPSPIPSFTPTLPWDTDPNHFKYINNVIHDSGMTAAADTARTALNLCTGEGHADGNGIILDDWSRAQNPCNGPAYPYQALVAGNVVYNIGGRGVYVLSTQNFGGNGSCPGVPVTTAGPRTIINNVAYNTGLDPSNNGAGELAILYGAIGETWKNNIGISTHGEPAFTWTTAGWGDSGSSNPMANNLTFDGTVGHTSLNIDNTTNKTYFVNSTALEGVDPKLTNLSAHDFHPLAGSPVLGAGSTVTLSTVPAAFPYNFTPDGFAQSSPPNVGSYLATTGSIGVAGPVSISAGGAAAAPFIADAGYFGGSIVTNNPSGSVDTSLVTNVTPAPTSVYRSERYGTFTYTVSALTIGKAYTVNLHFTEDADTAAGQRLMDVSINGTNVLSSFDIYGSTGAQHKAIVESFTANADTNGRITISFVPHTGSTDFNAKVDGVEVLLPVSDPTALGNFPYIASRWYTPDYTIPSRVTANAPQANIIRCTDGGMHAKATASNVATRVVTADAAGHLQFAIYTNGPDNRPASLVATSGSMGTTPSGVISSALSSNVQGGPGGTNFGATFWFCANTDSATASFVGINNTEGIGPSIIGSTSNANILSTGAGGNELSHLSCTGSACTGGSSTYGTWPSSLAGTTWTDNTSTKMSMMAIEFVSVP